MLNLRIQVLIATLGQPRGDYTLLDNMNIQTDAIVGNQADRNEVHSFGYRGSKITWLTFNERGVGLNRNNALMRADAELVVFADDDMVFDDNYKEKILKAYEEISDADVIVFNIRDSKHSREDIRKGHRVGWHNYLN